MDISLVIPAYNESKIIKDTVSRALDILSRSFSDFELIVVDDGSTDGTTDVLAPILQNNISLIACDENRGKGSAVRTGILASTGDIVFFTDADLAYGVDIIHDGAKILRDTGADIVVGSRRLTSGGYGNYPAVRQIASKCFSLLLSAASGIGYDTQCGFKGFTRLAANDIFSSCETDGFSFDFEAMMLACLRGYKIVEMPAQIVSHRPTRLSVTKDGIKMLGEVARIRRTLKKSKGNFAQ